MSPRTKARMAGAFYLATVVGGIVAEGFISGRLVVSNNAAATAANIMSHEPVFRLGFTVYLVEMLCQITLTALMYQLLKPVSKSIVLYTVVRALLRAYGGPRGQQGTP